ncbi:MAG: HD domain-containing phosphohydrolase [Thermodesulfovibrionales bacterium]|jgi:HD superfamily phosphohydrolase YqeK
MSESKISNFAACIMAAFANYALYAGKHPIIDEFTARAFDLLKDLYAGEVCSMTMIGNSLVFNDDPITEKGIHFDNFLKRLRRKGIEKIEIRRGVTMEELRQFIASMTAREAFPGSPHISVGIIEVRTSAERFSLRGLIDDNIAKVREIFRDIAEDTKMDIGQLEETVTGLMSALKREANVLRILSPVKTFDEYTYVHAANVSVLTLFQAETLNLDEELAGDMGLAGLLHDVGKVFVPAEILLKQTELDLEEWHVMKLHPVHGARYLSAVPDIPKLAMIAAFEHHRKLDGSGYPEKKLSNERQHIVSQLVAIADFFDSLRTERPYRTPVDIGTTIDLLKEGAGKDFNPILVDHFVGALKNLEAL